MLKMKVTYGFIILIMVITISCSKNEERECVPNEPANVTSVEAPSEGNLGETISMVVNFQVIDGCGEFGKFIETGNGLTRTIEVEAIHTGCGCYHNMPVVQTTYDFTPNSSGEYVFRFKSGTDEFKTATVLVSEE